MLLTMRLFLRQWGLWLLCCLLWITRMCGIMGKWLTSAMEITLFTLKQRMLPPSLAAYRLVSISLEFSNHEKRKHAGGATRRDTVIRMTHAQQRLQRRLVRQWRPFMVVRVLFPTCISVPRDVSFILVIMSTLQVSITTSFTSLWHMTSEKKHTLCWKKRMPSRLCKLLSIYFYQNKFLTVGS